MTRWEYIKQIIPNILERNKIKKRLAGRYGDELNWGRGSIVDSHYEPGEHWDSWLDPWLSERDYDELQLALIDEHVMNPKNLLKNIFGERTYKSMEGTPYYGFDDLHKLKEMAKEFEEYDINYKTPYEEHIAKYPPDRSGFMF